MVYKIFGILKVNGGAIGDPLLFTMEFLVLVPKILMGAAIIF